MTAASRLSRVHRDALRTLRIAEESFKIGPKVCLKIIRMGLSIDISTLKGRSLDLQSSAES